MPGVLSEYDKEFQWPPKQKKSFKVEQPPIFNAEPHILTKHVSPAGKESSKQAIVDEPPLQHRKKPIPTIPTQTTYLDERTPREDDYLLLGNKSEKFGEAIKYKPKPAATVNSLTAAQAVSVDHARMRSNQEEAMKLQNGHQLIDEASQTIPIQTSVFTRPLPKAKLPHDVKRKLKVSTTNEKLKDESSKTSSKKVTKSPPPAPRPGGRPKPLINGERSPGRRALAKKDEELSHLQNYAMRYKAGIARRPLGPKRISEYNQQFKWSRDKHKGDGRSSLVKPSPSTRPPFATFFPSRKTAVQQTKLQSVATVKEPTSSTVVAPKNNLREPLFITTTSNGDENKLTAATTSKKLTVLPKSTMQMDARQGDAEGRISSEPLSRKGKQHRRQRREDDGDFRDIVRTKKFSHHHPRKSRSADVRREVTTSQRLATFTKPSSHEHGRTTEYRRQYNNKIAAKTTIPPDTEVIVDAPPSSTKSQISPRKSGLSSLKVPSLPPNVLISSTVVPSESLNDDLDGERVSAGVKGRSSRKRLRERGAVEQPLPTNSDPILSRVLKLRQLRTRRSTSASAILSPEKLPPAGISSLGAAVLDSHMPKRLREAEEREIVRPVSELIPNITGARKWMSEYDSNFIPPQISFSPSFFKSEEKRFLALKELKDKGVGERLHEVGVSATVPKMYGSPIKSTSITDIPALEKAEEGQQTAISDWFSEVLELRRRAAEYRQRSRGTHFSREHMAQLLAAQAALWDEDESVSSPHSLPAKIDDARHQLKKSVAMPNISDNASSSVKTASSVDDADSSDSTVKEEDAVRSTAAVAGSDTAASLDFSEDQEEATSIDSIARSSNSHSTTSLSYNKSKKIKERLDKKTSKEKKNSIKKVSKQTEEKKIEPENFKTYQKSLATMTQLPLTPPREDRPILVAQEGRISTPELRELQAQTRSAPFIRIPAQVKKPGTEIPAVADIRRHHLDRTTPALGGAILGSPSGKSVHAEEKEFERKKIMDKIVSNEFDRRSRKRYTAATQTGLYAGSTITPSEKDWFSEVLELRQRANEYRRRGRGEHFSREHLAQLIAAQASLWEASSTDDNGDSTLFKPYRQRSKSDSRLGLSSKDSKKYTAVSLENDDVHQINVIRPAGLSTNERETKQFERTGAGHFSPVISGPHRRSSFPHSLSADLKSPLQKTQQQKIYYSDRRPDSPDSGPLTLEELDGHDKRYIDEQKEFTKTDSPLLDPALVYREQQPATSRQPVARKLAWDSSSQHQKQNVKEVRSSDYSDDDDQIRDGSRRVIRPKTGELAILAKATEAMENGGRIPTPEYRKRSDYNSSSPPRFRHHLDRTTPAAGGPLLTMSPVSRGDRRNDELGITRVIKTTTSSKEQQPSASESPRLKDTSFSKHRLLRRDLSPYRRRRNDDLPTRSRAQQHAVRSLSDDRQRREDVRRDVAEDQALLEETKESERILRKKRNERALRNAAIERQLAKIEEMSETSVSSTRGNIRERSNHRDRRVNDSGEYIDEGIGSSVRQSSPSDIRHDASFRRNYLSEEFLPRPRLVRSPLLHQPMAKTTRSVSPTYGHPTHDTHLLLDEFNSAATDRPLRAEFLGSPYQHHDEDYVTRSAGYYDYRKTHHHHRTGYSPPTTLKLDNNDVEDRYKYNVLSANDRLPDEQPSSYNSGITLHRQMYPQVTATAAGLPTDDSNTRYRELDLADNLSPSPQNISKDTGVHKKAPVAWTIGKDPSDYSPNPDKRDQQNQIGLSKGREKVTSYRVPGSDYLDSPRRKEEHAIKRKIDVDIDKTMKRGENLLKEYDDHVRNVRGWREAELMRNPHRLESESHSLNGSHLVHNYNDDKDDSNIPVSKAFTSGAFSKRDAVERKKTLSKTTPNRILNELPGVRDSVERPWRRNNKHQ